MAMTLRIKNSTFPRFEGKQWRLSTANYASERGAHVATLRNNITSQRKNLTQAELAAASAHFLSLLKERINTQKSLKIACYLAVNGELDLGPTIDYLMEQNHEVYLPIIAGNRLLTFGRLFPNTIFQKNHYGIDEPVTDQIISATELDIVLAPGVAFDKQNNRLGMGGGFYDTTFEFKKEATKPLLIGVGYDFQLVEQLQAQPWDIRVDEQLVTEIKFKT